MSGKQYAVGITIGAALASGFGRATAGARRELDAVGRATDMLNRKRQTIRKFEVDSRAVTKLSGELSTAQQKLKGVQQRLRANPGDTGLRREAQAMGTAVGRLSERLTQQRRQLGASRRALTDAGLSVRHLGQQYDSLTTSMDRMAAKQRRIDQLNRRRDELQAERRDLRGQMVSTAAVGLTIGAPLIKSIRTAIGFEDAMAKVAAVSGASGTAQQQLTQQARQLGRDTVFTASDAAAGQQYLAMAGFKANQIIASMPGMLNLAAAGAMDLGAAADISSNILTGFALKAEQSTRVSDVLARTFTTSNTNLAQLGDAMKYVAPVASGLGASLEQTSAMVGLLGDAGLQGSLAGTALRAGFLRLAKLPKMALKALERVGVKTMDSEGNLKDMPSLLKDIHKATKSMGTGERGAFVAQVFGVEAASAFMKLLDDAGSGALDRKIADLQQNSAGTGARIAERMNSTTGGALRRMNSALEDAAIELGKVFLPGVASAAESLASASRAVSAFATAHPDLIKNIGLAGVALLGLRFAVLSGRLALNLMMGGANSWARRTVGRGLSRIPGLSGRMRGGNGWGGVLADGAGLAAGGVQRVFVVNMGASSLGGQPASAPGARGRKTPGAMGRARGLAARALGWMVPEGFVQSGMADRAIRGIGKTARFAGRAIAPVAIASSALAAGGILTDANRSGRDKKVALSGLAGGALGGVAGGALAGMAVGSVVPVVGNLVGALIGGALGALGGDALGRSLADALVRRDKVKGKDILKVPKSEATAETKSPETKTITSKHEYTLQVNGVGMQEVETMIRRMIDERERDQEVRLRSLMHDGVNG
ncbi:phage tail tape measure protein [Pandoraea fibrosis]|uniref:Phage tail tape measure protein n=1 Tax=Pandoraea fibrosis TaxID=1891094 RepID=A0A5E4XFP1_9BURK|nr:phage tail tape measure protein [Pandoraea fibrosis]VVE35005.1 phage tail tape measure protein [Pandoraea fibrosis]